MFRIRPSSLPAIPLRHRLAASLLSLLCHLLPSFTLRRAQHLGALLGWLTWILSRKTRRTLSETLTLAGYRDPALKRQAIAAAGTQAIEALWIWVQPLAEVLRTIQRVHGWEAVEAARREGFGLLFLTPHLGCFEITALWGGAHFPLTILYRPPRLPSLRPLLTAGRARGGVHLAAADRAGVRALIAALRRGEGVGILPDQTPKAGHGIWAPFFGHPVWTMTLAARLSLLPRVSSFLAWGERLPEGGGFALHFTPLLAPAEPIPQRVVRINALLEQLIRSAPHQYLWVYPRFRSPPGVPPPETFPSPTLSLP
ncbi:MAG: lysophospholipid acyltransferase family protein [Hydrogenophilus sp.]|nr:lysophospholipid acyltransferase family protein [Hydrogenophilus sp.]